MSVILPKKNAILSKRALGFHPHTSGAQQVEAAKWGNLQANQKWQAVAQANILWHVALGPPHLHST